MPSVFSTPLLTPFLRILASAALRLTGWKVELNGTPAPPYVLVGAPHTSNWDFALMVCSLLQLRAEASWFGKDSLFQPPFGGLMRWLGGIPVDREQPNNVVARTAQALIANPDMVLCVAPEGTRKKVVRWRTGFYFIALQARVPIVLVAIDARQRQVRYLGKHSATGNAECEIDEIRQKFAGFSGLIAENSLHCQD